MIYKGKEILASNTFKETTINIFKIKKDYFNLDIRKKIYKIMKKKRKQKFFPLSYKFGIPGVSYQIQLGTVNGKWALILLKGRDVIASQAYEGSEFPNRSELISWIISLINLSNFNSNKFKKDVETWVDQAINKYKQLYF